MLVASFAIRRSRNFLNRLENVTIWRSIHGEKQHIDISPTTAVRNAHIFDEQQLTKYLQNQGAIGVQGVSIKQFANGQSNPTFLISDEEGRRLVVRKQPPGKLLRGAHAVVKLIPPYFPYECVDIYY
jgi:hypothetical protein